MVRVGESGASVPEPSLDEVDGEIGAEAEVEVTPGEVQPEDGLDLFVADGGEPPRPTVVPGPPAPERVVTPTDPVRAAGPAAEVGTQPAAMTLVETRELASEVVAALLADDPRRALDLLHGRRGGDEDRHFPGQFRAAFQAESVAQGGRGAAAMLASLSDAERVLLNAYIDNPEGRARPEDIAFLAVEGAGTWERGINDIFHDMAARIDPRTDPEGYAAAVTAMEERFAERYSEQRGGEGLHETLTDGFFRELNDTDSARYRAARIQAPDALALYLTGQGVVGADEEGMLSVLERNIGGMEDLAAAYGYVADGEPGAGLERLREAVDDELGDADSLDAQRALVLIDGSGDLGQRAIDYLTLTGEAYLEGDVDADAFARSVRNLTGDEGPIDGSTLAFGMEPDLIRRLSEASDPSVGEIFQQLSATSELDGEHTLTGEFERLMASYPYNYATIRSRLDGLSDDERHTLLEAMPDLRERMLAPFENDPIETARIEDAIRGGIDAETHAYYMSVASNRASDLARAIEGLSASERADFAGRVDERFGEGTFERALDRLSADERRQISLALAVPTGVSGESVDQLVGQIRSILDAERGDEGWVGVSTALNDFFGVSGPVVDDAFRELTAAARDMRAAVDRGVEGEALRPHLMALIHAQMRVQRSIETYDQDREDLANTASNIALIAVAGATLGAGISLTTLAIAAGSAGTAQVSTQGLVRGTDYSSGEAAVDFFSAAALEVAGIGVGHGVIRGVQYGGGALASIMR
ncbi:MAG: hypothetical protein AAFP04_09595 [Myxococcota bacterium]